MAVAELKLDKKIEPLSRDTQFRVRPRSALGLKYIELQPGTSKATWQSGDTIPVKQSSEPLEFEDLFSTFDRETRPNIQSGHRRLRRRLRRPRSARSTGRSQALNPFFKALTPVMRNLSDPDTELDQFFLQIGRASAQVAPVAANAGAAVHRHGGHVRGHLRQPARAPGHDREERADDGRLDRLVPSAAARSWSTSPTSRLGCGPRRSSCRARSPQSTAPSRSARRSCRGRWS